MENSDFDKTAFFGKITASVAHDLQNVLAVVKETSGLMQDILLMYQDDLSPELAEKMAKSISSVQKQVSRGVGITSGLNGFAHTSDLPIEKINIIDIVSRLILLTQRIFNHKGVTIDIEESESFLTIMTDPFYFQMLVFKGIEYMSKAKSGVSVFSISVQNNISMNINLTCTADSNIDQSEQDLIWQDLCTICEGINATIKLSDDRTNLILEFS